MKKRLYKEKIYCYILASIIDIPEDTYYIIIFYLYYKCLNICNDNKQKHIFLIIYYDILKHLFKKVDELSPKDFLLYVVQKHAEYEGENNAA